MFLTVQMHRLVKQAVICMIHLRLKLPVQLLDYHLAFLISFQAFAVCMLLSDSEFTPLTT